jgi:hypothetical protein
VAEPTSCVSTNARLCFVGEGVGFVSSLVYKQNKNVSLKETRDKLFSCFAEDNENYHFYATSCFWWNQF